MSVQKAAIAVLAVLLALFTLDGCGGGGGGGNNVQGSVSGVVFDINGNPVRGATVYTGDQYNVTTVSNSAGSYRLTPVAGQVNTIYASLTSNGVQYVGENTFQVYNGEQTKTVNITIVPASGVANVSGFATDRSGQAYSGVQISALASTGFSAEMVLSGSDGSYRLNNLVPGVSYTILASGKGFNSDRTVTTFAQGESRTLNFNLNDATGGLTAVPANLTATAYTSPSNPSRSVTQDRAIQNMKRILDPSYAKRHPAASKTRSTPLGNYTEVDLNWTGQNDPALLGYSVYRTQGNSVPTTSIDFLGDPLASFYADLDASFLVGNSYTYGITSLNTVYGTTGGAESALSNTSTAQVLGDLVLAAVDPVAVTFNWQQASYASTYAVYLFDQYPDLGVTSIWNSDNPTDLTGGTQKTYSGSGALISGHTYYYIVVGRSSGTNGVTFSPVGTFTKS
jgi:hypothetical protein